MSEETTCAGTPRCICSPVSGDGASRSEWPGGPTTDQHGLEAVPASRFPLPEKEPVQMTFDIFGPRCEGSSQSADPQSSSENKSRAPQLSERLGERLMERLALYGSMEYSLTWKRRVTPAGRLYYQQRASARRISGNGCGGVQSGWLTPQAQVGPHGYRPAGPNGQLDLDRQVLVAGWPTATAVDRVRDEETLQKCADFRKRNANQNTVPLYLGEVAAMTGWPTARAEDSESTGAHRGSPDTLTSAAQVSGLPTPKTPTGGAESAERKQESGRTGSGGGDLQAAATLAGWCTPNAMDGGQTSRGGDRIGEALLAGQAQAAGWATPQTMDVMESYNLEARKTKGGCVSLKDQMHIVTGAQPGSPAQTGPRGVLNPQFPVWLQGYPPEWTSCAPGCKEWGMCQEAMLRRS